MATALTKVAYTTSATAKGGRAGHVTSADGLVDFDLAQPGTTPEPAVNPETLFASGYAACFQGALANRAKTKGFDTSDSTVTAEVSFGLGRGRRLRPGGGVEGEHPRCRQGTGRGTARAGPPVLPVLQGDPRQHQRDAGSRRITSRFVEFRDQILITKLPNHFWFWWILAHLAWAKPKIP